MTENKRMGIKYQTSVLIHISRNYGYVTFQKTTIKKAYQPSSIS